MKQSARLTTLVIIGLLSLSTVASAAVYNRQIDREFTASEFEKLEIRIPHGKIYAAPGNDGVIQIKIDLETKVDNEAKADELFDQTEVQFDDSDSELSLVIKDLPRKGMFSFFGRNRNKVSASVTVAVPRNFDVQLDTGSGLIQAEGLMGKIVLDTGSGNIVGNNLKGEIFADTGSGNVALDSITGNVKADTGSGNIEITSMDGELIADTGSGSINATGNIHLFKTDTGSGSIKLQSFVAIKDKSDADTGSGSIRIQLPGSSSFRLDADTGSGRIDCNFPMQEVQQKKSSLKAIVNGGGPLLRLDTGSGSILVQPNS